MVTTEVTVSPEDLRASRVPERVFDPCIVVIFGASSNLTKTKITACALPPGTGRIVPPEFAVVGVARRPLKDEFVNDMQDGIIKGGGVEANDPNWWIFCKE